MSILYTAVATATGGRSGHVESADGAVSLDLAIPRELGGSGKAGANPEELFAAGYAACFGSAAEHLAKRQKLETGDITVTAHVGIGPNETGGFGLAVTLDVAIAGLDQTAAEKLVHGAHQVCPYSNATRGNIDVKLNVTGGVSSAMD